MAKRSWILSPDDERLKSALAVAAPKEVPVINERTASEKRRILYGEKDKQ